MLFNRYDWKVGTFCPVPIARMSEAKWRSSSISITEFYRVYGCKSNNRPFCQRNAAIL